MGFLDVAKRLMTGRSPTPRPGFGADTGFTLSEAELRAMLAQAAAGIVRSDLEGRILTANDRFCEMLGRPLEAIAGHLAAEFTHSDDVASTHDFVASTQVVREERQLSKRYVRPDGGIVWALLSVRTLRDDQGRAYGFMTVAVDITAQKVAEAELRESDQRFRRLADTAPSPVWLTNAEGAVEFVNVALIDFYGQPAEAILGHVWKQAIHPDDAAGVEAVQAGARPHHRPYSFECRFRRADGAWRWMRVSVNPRFDGDGDFRGYVGLSFDVTESREALEALRESEQRFRAIADTAPVLIWVTGEDRQRLFVNEAYVAYMGGDYETVRDADWRSFIHPDDQAGLVADSLAGEATGEPFSLEARYLRHDGEYRWLKSFSRPRLGPGGTLIGFVGVAFDVTDIRETSARLGTAAVEREAILNQLAEGVVVTDPQGRVTFVNEAAVRVHGGFPLGDISPSNPPPFTILTEEGRPYPLADQPLMRTIRTGEVVEDERWRIVRPDGDYTIAVGSAKRVIGPTGEQIGAVLTLRDETARIQAEQLLAESESRFRTVADSAPVFIWMTDPDTRIIFANLRYKTVFGVETGDLMGGHWKSLAHPDDLEPFTARFMAAMKAGGRFAASLRVRHPTLGLRWLQCEGIPRFDASGTFKGYVGASLDVTDAKQAENDLKRINELLEERVSEALAEKARAEADLMHAQRMEAIGRLTGGVAHDFNNLLTVVIGALDLILRSPDDAARRKKLGEAALAAARRGESLTHQLLAFSRRQALRPQPVDLNALIHEGEPLLRRAVGEAVVFELDLRPGEAAVSVDPAQFEAALLNLIVNARDAVGDKGRIVIATRAVAVEAGEVNELPPGPYVRVSVTDDGSGMDPQTMTRVFEPFFTTKSVGKGTGLGLSQVYGFARQSGGGVQILSTVGEGSEIRLYLPPLTADQSVAEVAVRADADALAGERRLLLVEDDEGVSAVAVELLEGLGLTVTAVENALAALEVLEVERFDVMLSDIVMPGGMTGIELARQAGATWPDMRIMLTSGYAGEDVDAALGDAPWPFLRKPYSRDHLRDALVHLLPIAG